VTDRSAVAVLACLLSGACASGDAPPTDTAAGDPAGDTAAPWAPFTRAVGTERFQYAYWLEEAGLRNCDLMWAVEATPAAGCEGCEYGFSATMSLLEEQSIDDGTCAVFHTNRTQTLAYLEDYEGNGPSVMSQQGGRWFWWAYAEPLDRGLRWTFGWEDYQAESLGELPPGYEDGWLTNLWESEITFE